ncbi:MAG: DUF4198 domain-containing protein [Planctomycetota bacterium]
MKFRKLCVGAWAVVVLVVAPIAHAHDFWIEPSAFDTKPGEVVKVGLRVGEQFKGEPVKRNPEKLDRFELVTDRGTQPIVGQDGEDPAGVVKIDEPGVAVIGYRSKRSSIELEAEKFEAYLKVEGLEHILPLRAQRGESTKPGREIYSRCAKALLQVGEGAGTGFDRRLDFTLELVPLRNPKTVKPGQDELPVVLLYQGKPLAGAMVMAMAQADPAAVSNAKTDSEGKASFKLSKGGVWMIKVIHMVRLPEGGEADWESFWATLTFEISAGT